MQQKLNIAWTTVGTHQAAKDLARKWLEEAAAVCIQIDGPIESIYRWQGAIESENEYRITVKFLDAQLQAVEAILKQFHPYTTPQWIVVTADRVSEAYYKWTESEM